MIRFLFVIALTLSSLHAGIVQDVRAALRANNKSQADALLSQFEKANGANAEWLEAYSWLARDALGRSDYEAANRYAADTKKRALVMLKSRQLDAEPHLPIALGAAIEVEAQAAAKQGERDQAVAYLRNEIKRYYNTSIRTRLQKNLNLLSLEGKPAPALETKLFLGEKAPTLASLKGKVVLLFFWAHWCGDCKRQMPLLADLRKEFAGRDFVLIGPTQRYGYAEGGREVGPEEELKYIDSVRKGFYAPLSGMPVPVSEETFKRYGASTTPTLVLIDKAGIVRLYNPGNLTADQLKAAIMKLL
jgi:thiol-disulfide isomerase/thioredoxin